MLALLLILCPLPFAAVAFLLPSERVRPWLVPLGALIHFGLTAAALAAPEVAALEGRLGLDPPGRFFLGFLSLMFLLCALYAPPYLRLRPKRSNRVLCACLMLLLAAMTAVVLAQHLGLMWVAVEATTLAIAPCIYFNHNARSLEATWKFLLICSVGIALALLGSFFLAYSLLFAGHPPSLLFNDLVKAAPELSGPWLHAAFVLLFVGYGTKMGLAPMHTWKPDAYGEAPGLIGALASAAVTSCAFLAILRVYRITAAAPGTEYAGRMLLAIGLFSMGLAAVSMARQRDIKRLLAYSSVEHMGILAVGLGLGGAATAAALLHVVHNGFTKGALFLAAGNIHRAYGSKFAGQLGGVVHGLPFSGWMFLAGFFAITASPPFAPFVSEFRIVRAAFDTGHFWEGGLFVLFLLLVFVGMGATVLSFCLGSPEESKPNGFRDGFGTGLPVFLFMALVVLLGVYTPPALERLIDEAAGFLAP